MSNIPQILHIDSDRGFVILDGGTWIPIVNWIDAYGEECMPDEAMVLVAGTKVTGFLTILLYEDDDGDMGGDIVPIN